jgi:hypothetical protein
MSPHLIDIVRIFENNPFPRSLHFVLILLFPNHRLSQKDIFIPLPFFLMVLVFNFIKANYKRQNYLRGEFVN